MLNADNRPDEGSTAPAADSIADLEFQQILVKPSRFWAIVFGEQPTDAEIQYINARDYLRLQALTVLTERNDPRVRWFGESACKKSLDGVGEMVAELKRNDIISGGRVEPPPLRHVTVAGYPADLPEPEKPPVDVVARESLRLKAFIRASRLARLEVAAADEPMSRSDLRIPVPIDTLTKKAALSRDRQIQATRILADNVSPEVHCVWILQVNHPDWTHREIAEALGMGDAQVSRAIEVCKECLSKHGLDLTFR
jgi:hypothetical protein